MMTGSWSSVFVWALKTGCLSTKAAVTHPSARTGKDQQGRDQAGTDDQAATRQGGGVSSVFPPSPRGSGSGKGCPLRFKDVTGVSSAGHVQGDSRSISTISS